MVNELFQLSGKKALVTGGSRGIGLAIARGLAHHGADVAIVARDKQQLEDAYNQIESYGGGAVWTFANDLQHLDGMDEFFKEVVNVTGGIDILANCAGVIRRGPAEDVSLESWNEVIRINLSATFVLAQAFCRYRKEQGSGGKILNIGSLQCHSARPDTSSYTASKGGLLMLTRCLAVEWAKYGINVNAIGPGYVLTELTRPLKEKPEFNRWVIDKTPLGRWGRPEELVGAAVFLCSSASDFVTGQIIYVDGGWLANL